MTGNSRTGMPEDVGEALAPHRGSVKERPRSDDGGTRQHFPYFQSVACFHILEGVISKCVSPGGRVSS
jgi:hypothetical protein